MYWANFIIELDGGQHAENNGYDERRTKFLRGKGYQVLRFWNNQMLQKMDSVLEAIRIKTTLSPTPLPQAGEGL